MEIFSDIPPEKRDAIGKTRIGYRQASSILSRASGFMDDYDFTLNPYSGCSFGCSYCYAAFFSRTAEKRKDWGFWLEVKENAVELLKKIRPLSLHNKRIYMSSVTDPYQPIEKELLLTRKLLSLLLPHQPRLVIQTRSPLVTRDIDLFIHFKAIQVNMTITTDSETVRKTFEPLCPSNELRLAAIQAVHAAGVEACITMTPLLPVENPERFAQLLKATGVPRFVGQPFHSEKGRFVGGTRENALRLLKNMNWDDSSYQRTLETIQRHIPQIELGKDGFRSI